MSRAEYMKEYRKKKKESENVMCIMSIYFNGENSVPLCFLPMKISKAIEIKSLLNDQCEVRFVIC